MLCSARRLFCPSPHTPEMASDTRLDPLASFQIPPFLNGPEIQSYLPDNPTRHFRYSRSPATIPGHESTSSSSEDGSNVQESSIGQFQFVHSHASSGKLEGKAGTQVRSHVMRKYHQKRHSLQKRKINLSNNNIKDSCRASRYGDHTFMVLVDDSMWRGRTSSQPPISPSTDDNEGFIAKASPSELRPRDLNADSGLDFTRRLALCTSCGEVRVQSSTSQGSIVFRDPFSRSQSPRGTGSFDPFASSVIPITLSMQELLHHCKLSLVHTVLLRGA